jgi:hypothetical protein
MKGKAACSTLLLLVGLSAFSNGYADDAIEKQATQMLLSACPRLAATQAASEISSLVATRKAVESLDEQNMGWQEIVQVTVKLTSPVKSLPHDFYASGQTCQYDVGHGGVITAKSSCKKICDLDVSSKGPAFLPITATKALQLAAE